MTGPENIDATAAEFVLGTLDAGERQSVDARRISEPWLDAAIGAWEQRLAPLNEAVTEVAPPAGLLERIEAQLAGTVPAAAELAHSAADRFDQPERDNASSGNVIALERRLVRWRRAALATSAIAASLALVIGLRETVYPPRPQNFVAVFQKDDAQPAFLLTIDLASREMTIRPVSAVEQPGKTFQLWILAEPLGPVPQSLGLLEASLAPTRKSLTGFAPALLQKATFGISVEPAGGSPTGRPTSPALHGKLHSATP